MSIMENTSYINQILQSYFPIIYFNPIIINNETNLIIIIKNKLDQLCLELQINKTLPDILLIKNIKKCDDPQNIEETMAGIGSGKYLLHCIELLAKDLHINKIIIDNDASVINIRCKDKSFVFSLKYLYLFSFGYTWYGKYGFKLKYQSDLFIESIHEFINQPFTHPEPSAPNNRFLFWKTSSPQNIKVKEYFQNMLMDIQKKTREHKCTNKKDMIDLEQSNAVLQHYIQLWNQFISSKKINDDGPYIKDFLFENAHSMGGSSAKSNVANAERCKTINRGGVSKKRMVQSKMKSSKRKTNKKSKKIRKTPEIKKKQKGGEPPNIYWVNNDSQCFDQITEPAIDYNYIYIAIGAKDNNSNIENLPGYGNKGPCELIPSFLEEYLLFEKDKNKDGTSDPPKLLIVIIDEFNAEDQKAHNIAVLNERCIELNNQNPLCKIDIYVINKLFDGTLSAEILDYLNKSTSLPEPMQPLQEPMQPLDTIKRQHTRDNLWICNYVHFYGPNPREEQIENHVSQLCVDIAKANNNELINNVYKWLGKLSPNVLCSQVKYDGLKFKYYRLDKTPNKENVIKTMKLLLNTINIITICTSNIVYDDETKQMHNEWDYYKLGMLPENRLLDYQYDQIYDILFNDYTRFLNRKQPR